MNTRGALLSKNLFRGLVLSLLLIVAAASRAAEPERLTIQPRLVHLRDGEGREWSTFPASPDGVDLETRFEARPNEGEYALRLRQQDVKRLWRVSLNGRPLGTLVRDEMDLIAYLPIPPGLLVEGENVLRVESTRREGQAADDIRVGEMWIELRPVRRALDEARVEIEVVDADTRRPLPARITIVDAHGSRHPTTAVSNDHLAAREGVIYTLNGRASFAVPAGNYTIYAGRGFEYSLAQVELKLGTDSTVKHTLAIRREVPTAGYVACDTHIHTETFSGHGDATLDERLITLAGEGIELPIATDHNVVIDYRPRAERLGAARYFTPVVGCELTTRVGHFNIFPMPPEASVPDFKLRRWDLLFDDLFATPGVRVAVLNHARDLHAGTRPFGLEHFNAAVGENLDGWPLRFNAMECVNSGATQTDPLRLFHDWMTLLNRGQRVTPIGASDSHDVTRYIVGQGRTYIRCDDGDPAHIDVGAAVNSLLAGRVMVSYGLAAELTVSGKYQSGDLAALSGDELEVALRVLGPHWVEASRARLYLNGQLLREEPIAPSAGQELPLGVKWRATWKIPRPRHDAHLVLIALGPGIEEPYWPTAKPYQPASPDWRPRVLGAGGAVWLDGDGDGRLSTPRDYARRALAASNGDPAKLVSALSAYDAAVAAQAAELYRRAGGALFSDSFAAALDAAAPQARKGLLAYREAWRAAQRARAER
jgi:hypothetical protein